MKRFILLLNVWILSLLLMFGNSASSISISSGTGIPEKSELTGSYISSKSVTVNSHLPKSPNYDVFSHAAQSFNDFFKHGELMAYESNTSTFLMSNNYNPGSVVGEGLHSYISDMKLKDDGSLLVLGGYDQLNVNQTFLDSLFTNTGNELVESTTADFVGFFIEYNPNTNQVQYATMLDSPGGNTLFETMEIMADGSVLILANNGSVIAGGQHPRDYFGGTPDADIYLLKLDGTNYNQLGNVTIGSFGLELLGIQKTPTRANPSNIRRYAISDLMDIDSDGKIIITGSTNSLNISTGIGFPITRYPGTTDPTWNTSNVLIDMIATNNTFVNDEAFLIKLNPDLSINWSRIYSGIGVSSQTVGGLTLDPFGRIYIGGNTGGGDATVPTNLFYPNYIDDLANLNEATSIFPRVVADSNDGFIAVFENNGSLHTATHIGGKGYLNDVDNIYDLEFYGNNSLFVAGEVFWSIDAFPYLSPHEDTYPNSYFNFAGGEGEFYSGHSRNGYVLSIDTSNFSVSYSHRFPLTPGSPGFSAASAVTNIEVVNNAIYFSGVISHDPDQVNETAFLEPGYIPSVTGPLANSQTSARNTNNSGSFSTMFFGLINSSRRVAYLTLPSGDPNIGNHTMQGAAAAHIPIEIGPNGDVFLGYEDMYGLSVQQYSILDQDGDGLADWRETNVYGTDPSKLDTDGDELSDSIEIYGLNEYSFTSDPLLQDTDGDCINDNLEVLYGLNPRVVDANVDLDNDGLNSYDEFALGLDINNNDTDSDGIDDWTEVFVTYTNGSEADSDFDGLNDPIEIDNDFDPWDPDMDNDGALDGQEFNLSFTFTYRNGTTELRKTDIFRPDTDTDGLLDGLEIKLATLALSNATNPVMYDADYDGLNDYVELFQYKSSALEADIDGDLLNDSEELLIYFTHPFEADIDADGLNDSEEIFYGTDPWVADEDNDGLNDGQEILFGTNPHLADEDNDGLNDSIEVIYGSNSTNSDSDYDLLPDYYEYHFGLNSSRNETYLDLDNDTLLTIWEYHNGTHPLFADIDEDGLDDAAELNFDTNSNNNDTDSDGLDDYYEIYILKTSPTNPDTDWDGLSDLYERDALLDPTYPDSDFDRLLDAVEIEIGTNPLLNDTDSDGILDGYESDFGTNPLLADTDGDSLSDGDEVLIYKTNPALKDSDFDGLDDNEEIELGTNPNDEDTDNDAVSDGDEITLGINPLNNDTDKDTILDGLEIYIFNTDANSTDTDGDLLPDNWEIYYLFDNQGSPLMNPKFNDAAFDQDEDGLNNLGEYNAGTDPRLADTDGDTILDGDEVENGTDPLVFDEQGFVDNVVKTISDNPAMGWGAIVSGLVGLGTLGQTLLSWLKKRKLGGI